MLEKRNKDFGTEVWIAATRVGRSATAVTDQILPVLYPVTVTAATHEGASAMFRTGVVTAVTRVLKSISGDAEHGDFADLSPEFHPLANELKSGSYYVETLEEYVPISELIAHPPYLDDARKFMRRKGEECIAEADRLDVLYKAVIAAKDV